MKYLLALAAGLLLAAPAASAQTTAAATPGAAPVPASQRKAAEELLVAMQMEQTATNALDQMVTAQLIQRPELKAVEPEMRGFLHKYMSWAALKDDMVDLYAREFSEKELKELRKFYASPIGQKFTGKQSQLMAAGMALGQRRMQEHLPELQKSIEDKMSSTMKE
ncbi:DUF2059 domain-containing protein [Hymenobacter jeollabukensis]|uniref:DUF2059 domain-containing protein n=1 Tax=Hymenobacter jeollabukensis TaxID=2025313 RepID=A0A5R8WLJ5_9BACT|nr:DUF2059 domain-containing protein [Hymenobacter jeollabukensis]TLM90104.1 DUF2059 domain-containing protein [Hymenobacter jeollabukensis]